MALSVTQPGVTLEDIADMAQSLGLYFRTPKGSIPFHVELGFAIFDYVDRNVSVVLKQVREITTGIALWDSRIVVKKVVPIFDTGKLKVTVTWHPADDSSNLIQSPFFI